jgi:AcrR family transcriptional regulator
MSGHDSPREQFLDAAARAIAARGYHGMSMRELARATGRSLAGFYSHFRSKDEVLYELQSRAFEALIGNARAAVAKAPPEAAARLRAFVHEHVHFVTSHPELLRVLVEEAGALAPAHRRTVRALKEQYYALGEALVVAVLEDCGRHAGEAERERLVYAVFGMLNWTYGWYDAARHGTAGEVAETLADLVLAGLAGSGGRAGRYVAPKRWVQ